jgi:hypothetical protein
MKLGIFGDSYATALNNPTPGWVNIIAEKYDVTNFAMSGSSLYYSAELLKQHHAEFDKIILVATQPGRLEITDTSLYDTQFPKERFIGNYTTVEQLIIYESKKTQPNNNRLRLLNVCKDYFLYLQHYQYEKYVQTLIINDVKTLRPDLILISGFPESYIPESTENNMFAITQKEDAHWSHSYRYKLRDFRNCHMTAENNVIFADKMIAWINGEPVHINTDDFVTPNNKEFYIKEYE